MRSVYLLSLRLLILTQGRYCRNFNAWESLYCGRSNQRNAWIQGKIAKPGEFTLRAFLNNKLSLDQSEAVIEIINANSKASLKAAQNSLEGGLKVKISEFKIN